jgi:hypothetical protein
MIKNYGYYDSEIIIKILINMGTVYSFINENILDWIVNTHEYYIINNIEYIINSIIKSNYYSNIDNSYKIVEYLIKCIDINKKILVNIFKNSIYNNHQFVFELFINNIFDYIDFNNLFYIVCLNINPNIPIQYTLIPLIMFNYNIKINWTIEQFLGIVKEWIIQDFDLDDRNYSNYLINIIEMCQEIPGVKSEDAPKVEEEQISYYNKYIINNNKWPGFYIKIEVF